MYGKGVDDNGKLVRPVLRCGRTRTKQSFAAECDINGIMLKYQKTGVLSHVRQNVGFYEDVSNIQDYAGALEIVHKAEELFMSVPAKIRAEFDNDPQAWLDFVQNPANTERLIQMGLMKRIDVVADNTGKVIDPGKVVPNTTDATP